MSPQCPTMVQLFLAHTWPAQQSSQLNRPPPTIITMNSINQSQIWTAIRYFYLWFFSCNDISSIASKLINIGWIRTGFHPYWKNVILYQVFYEYKKCTIMRLKPIFLSTENCLLYDARNNYFSIALKPINIHWIRTSS